MKHSPALSGAVLVLLAELTVAVATAENNEVALRDGVVVRFANVEEGAAHLKKRDPYLKALSRFDRQSRLRTDAPVTNEDVAEFAASQVVNWDAADIARLRSVVGAVRQKLAGYRLPFPETILLVQTTGKEEGDAAYCRTNAIVLPQKFVRFPPRQLERTMIHELFHVLSNQNPELRRELYAMLGFKPCPPIRLPASLRDRKLTNPDAPSIDSYIELDVEGEIAKAVPVLFASVQQYDPQSGQSFFRYLTFRLMQVEDVGGQWQPVERDGQPVLLDPKTTESYHEQIGRNTRYIIHPDEILADNFVHLVQNTANLATPRIVAEMRQRLLR